MTLETLPFDAAKYLDTPESQSELIADAFASGNASYISSALGTVARARSMTKVAKKAGITREALYRTLSVDGDPKLSTLLGVLKALDVSITATPAIPKQ